MLFCDANGRCSLLSNAMPDLRYRICRGCGKSSVEVGSLSWTRLCYSCGLQREIDNHDQLKAHSGPFAQHHRRQCVAAWGGVLLDDFRDPA